jgi:tetratricopeptide (TPR) repeat protein
MVSSKKSKSFLTLPIIKGKEPPFYDMNSMQFQNLCRDLLAVQGENIDCRIFGVNGQSQKGIDILCTRMSKKVEAAQVKCYEKFSVPEIKAASEAFLDNIDYWQKEGVNKFILIVACKIETVQEGKQITAEREKFKQLGIEYEQWDAIRIRDILRDHPELIYTHFESPEYWAKEICGQSLPLLQNQGMNYVNLQVEQSLVAKVDILYTILNSKINDELEEKRISLREGNADLVVEWIRNKRDNTKEWSEISFELKAKIIRLEAIINIDLYEDYDKAEELIKEARQIDPDGNDSRIRTFLMMHRQGPNAGLGIIKEMRDIDSLCLQASIHLQINHPKEALAILTPIKDQNNAEVFRLIALSYLQLKKLDEAVYMIGQAKNIAEGWESIQISDAIISYYSALSPAVFKDIFIDWPIPIELSLIKSATGVITELEKAIGIFYKISHNKNMSNSKRHFLNVWFAACLACHFQKQEEAEECFSNLILEYPIDHQIIAWIFYRKYHINMQLSHKAIKARIKKREASSIDIISCVMLDITRKLTKNSLFLLEKNKKIFIDEGNEKQYEY